MVAVKAQDVDGALRRPDPKAAVFLLYGPDAGLASERARAAAHAFVADPTDPFQLIRIDGDAIAGSPGALADEAGTIGLFGARRSIWVRAGSRNIAPAVEAVLGIDLTDTRIVIEAGDLQKSSPLRVACESSPRALAMPCYADTPETLVGTIRDTLQGFGLTIRPEARQVLVASLGGDRLATRGELQKLALHAHGRTEVTLDDVDAVISDVSGLATDAVVDAAFSGDIAGVESGLRRLFAEGGNPSVIIGGALRHGLALVAAAVDVEGGRPAGAVIDGWRGLHFRRKPALQKQLGRWSSARLVRAVDVLQRAVLDCRRMPETGRALTSRTLLDIASVSGRR